MKTPRRKTCRNCKEKFTPLPELPRASVCSSKCGLALATKKRIKAQDALHRKRKRGLRENDRGWQLKKAQEAFNRFIRMRDEANGLPCVSCGRFHNGKWNAGHYRAVGRGGASPLRFNELNVWRQCEPCNSHLSGNAVEFRIELVRRIGVDLVEWLERDHPPCKWTIPELRALRKYYENAVTEMVMTPGISEPF